jgi:hypothetical protein
MSEMSTLQRTVASLVEESGIEAPVHVRLLDLVSEVGELSKEVLEAADYAPFNPPENFANSTAVDLEAALAKYRERMALGGDPGSGG